MSRPRRINLLVAYPVVVLVAVIVAMLVIAPLDDVSVTSMTFYGVMQIFADYGLVALAVGLTIMIGEYDLSVAGSYILGGIVAIKLGVGSPLVGLLAAVAMGVVVGLIQGGVIARWQISSVPVTLGGYLTLVGIAYVISSGKTVNYMNFHVGTTLDNQVLGVFSLRSLLTAALFIVVWVGMRWSGVGSQIRAIGGDRRASRTAGVPVARTILVVMVASGALTAFAGALTAYSFASVTPTTTNLTPLLFGTVAAVLGGVALSGGRGSAAGIAVGALTYSALQETLGIMGAPQELNDVITGAVLLIVTIGAAPGLTTQWRLVRTRYAPRAAKVRPGRGAR
jgi:ribose transport system permease protein